MYCNNSIRRPKCNSWVLRRSSVMSSTTHTIGDELRRITMARLIFRSAFSPAHLQVNRINGSCTKHDWTLGKFIRRTACRLTYVCCVSDCCRVVQLITGHFNTTVGDYRRLMICSVNSYGPIECAHFHGLCAVLPRAAGVERRTLISNARSLPAAAVGTVPRCRCRRLRRRARIDKTYRVFHRRLKRS